MHTILIAATEDENRRYVVSLLQEHADWKVRVAGSGREALQLLSVERVDLVLTDTDAKMQDESPPRFLPELRRRYPDLPVVLMTTRGPNEAVVRALRLGAANYVARTSMARDLTSTVSRVLALCGRYKPGPELLASRTSTETTFLLPNDFDLFQPVIAYIQDELERFHDCRPSERVYIGIAVEEALLNALVHGNLEIGPEVREKGLETYENLIRKKSSLAPYKDRRIKVTCTFSRDDVRVRVTDEGPGFDVMALPDPTSPENRAKAGGRGLLLIRSFTDEIRHNKKGNEIELVKKRRDPEG